MAHTGKGEKSRIVSFRIKGEVKSGLEKLEARKHLKRSDLLREVFERGLSTYGRSNQRQVQKLRGLRTP